MSILLIQKCEVHNNVSPVFQCLNACSVQKYTWVLMGPGLQNVQGCRPAYTNMLTMWSIEIKDRQRFEKGPKKVTDEKTTMACNKQVNNFTASPGCRQPLGQVNHYGSIINPCWDYIESTS